MASIRRALLGLLVGLFVGILLGFAEGGLVLHIHGLRFASPFKEALKLGINYGVVIGAFVALFRLLISKIGLRGAFSLSLGLGFLFLGSHWLGKGSGFMETGLPAWIAAAGTSVILVYLLRKLPKRIEVRSGVLAGFLAVAMVLFAPDQTTGETSSKQTASEDAPNVVVLLIDTLRADHLSCYGYSQPGTLSPISPVLDGIAEQGTLFENTYAQAPWTRPSVASLMTGLYPTSHDTVTMYDRMPDGLETIATLLQNRGYRTAAFSANAQVSPNFGFNRGFDFFWTDVSYSLRNYCALNNLRRDFIHGLVATAPKLAAKLQGGSEKGGDKTRSSEAKKLNGQVMGWLDDQKDNTPTFLYVQYIDPHDPYDAPTGWQPEGVPGIHEVMGGIDFGSEMDSPPRPLEGSIFPAPPEAGLTDLLAHYDAEIRYCDSEVGNLISTLEERGILGPEDFLIITADHGEEFYDHEQWKHGHSLFQEMIRVPLIIRGPNILAQRQETPVQLVDVLPTISEWTGDPLTFPIHGRSLTPLLTSGSSLDPFPVFFERPKGAHPMQALRLGDHKIIRVSSEKDQDSTWLFYDLAQDPLEKNPLDTNSKTAIRLKSLLEEYRIKTVEDRVQSSRKTELSGDVAAALSSLGYLDGDEEED
ncbi:MAG: sulfatase-like hydrolase/transferase [Planctomycetota bacterium]|jgi:arylsulfatase A-like enzyme|nr:sulfatase-like hydrolase/transferase [Planctomycetota bacterium]MDP6942106.1 sulfatase-like hydrolase/transferase [Planctomycetota bacterium]